MDDDKLAQDFFEALRPELMSFVRSKILSHEEAQAMGSSLAWAAARFHERMIAAHKNVAAMAQSMTELHPAPHAAPPIVASPHKTINLSAAPDQAGETPRTDALIDEISKNATLQWSGCYEQMRDHAVTLERENAKLRERVGELESAHASLCDTVASAKRNSGLPDTGIELGCDLREHIWQISYAEVKQRQRTSEAESRLSALAKGAGELPEETGTIKTAREAGDMAPPAVQRMLKAYDELRSIAARALEDSKRLDWLDTLPKRRFKDHNGKEWPIISEIYINSHGHHVWLRNETADIVQAGEGKTIREAIDAALNSGGGEEK